MRHLLSTVHEFGLKFAKNQYIHIFTLSSLKIYVIKMKININSNIDKNKKYMSIKSFLLEYTRWYWQVPAIGSPDRLPDSNHVREDMDCLMMIFMDMLQNNFLHFLAYCWWLVILMLLIMNWHFTRLETQVILKTWKMFAKSLIKHFEGISSRFDKLHSITEHK